jgi:hypothetical protein
VLVVKRSKEGKAHGVQRPVYFLSEVLSPSKQRYPDYQKLAYSMFTTTQKLRQYFTVHPIIVVNEAPLSNILNNSEATGRASLWGIELSPGYHVREEKSNQISGITRFHSRMARTTKHGNTRPVKCLDNVIRWIEKGPRSRSRGSLNIAARRQAKIRVKDEFFTSF